MRSRPPRRRFVPRTIFETALVAVVPSITALACRRPLTVANRGFEHQQQTVAAQFAAPEETVDAASASESSDVIDAAAVADESSTAAVLAGPDHDVGPAPAVAYQGFAGQQPRPGTDSADAGLRPRSRRR